MGSVQFDSSLVPTPAAMETPSPTSYLFDGNGTDNYPGQFYDTPSPTYYFEAPPPSFYEWSPPYYDDGQEWQEPPPKGISTPVMAVLIIVGILCFATLIVRSYLHPDSVSQHASTANNNTTNNNNSNNNAMPTAIREPPTSEDMVLDAVRKMSVEDRKLFLSNILKTEKYKSSLAVASGGDGSSSFRKVFHKFSPDCCSICLEGFQNGDDMCASPNQACSHVFHRDCIFDWLLTHEICPICRRNYLQLDSVRSVREICCYPDVEGGGFPESSSGDPIYSDTENVPIADPISVFDHSATGRDHPMSSEDAGPALADSVNQSMAAETTSISISMTDA